MATNSVTDAMKSLAIAQIRELYTDKNIRIYDAPVKQGLKVPAFLVRIFKVHQEKGMTYQANRTFYFAITYFPYADSEDIENECLTVLENMQNNFKYLQQRYHIHEFEGEIVDETLVMTFDVTARMMDVLEFVKMRILEGVHFDTRTDN